MKMLSIIFAKTINSIFSLIFQALAVPTVAFEPRFQGAFRNLEYFREGTGPEKQEMMAYKVCKKPRI